MIKFTVKNSKTVGFGLSEENINRLKNGQPILVRGVEIGITNDILIFYGKTEEVIMKDLRKQMTKDTTIIYKKP